MRTKAAEAHLTLGEHHCALGGALSDADKRVATLASYGYTNGQIAHKLYITVSTVEQCLTYVCPKLGSGKLRSCRSIPYFSAYILSGALTMAAH